MVNLLMPKLPGFVYYDLSHDNPIYRVSRTVQETLPTSALVNKILLL